MVPYIVQARRKHPGENSHNYQGSSTEAWFGEHLLQPTGLKSWNFVVYIRGCTHGCSNDQNRKPSRTISRKELSSSESGHPARNRVIFLSGLNQNLRNSIVWWIARNTRVLSESIFSKLVCLVGKLLVMLAAWICTHRYAPISHIFKKIDVRPII